MWPLYGLFYVVLVGSSLQPNLIEATVDRCALDDDGTNEYLDTCLLKGERFIERLLENKRNLNNKRKRRKRDDVCQSFSHFQDCAQFFIKECPGMESRLHTHWRVIYEVLDCACNGTDSCKKSIECFQHQFKSKLARRCDAFYKFNVKQNTNDRCHFIYENVRCKEALVESACSPEAGVFAFHVAKIANRQHIAKHRCHIDRKREYKGFRYSEQCPVNLTDVMDSCERDFLSETRLQFRRDYDLIAEGLRRSVRNSCRDFRNYENCRQPLDNCREGTSRVYDYDSKLRIYLLKMQYICNTTQDGYTSHLRCYKEVLKNDTLSQCEHIWTDLKDMLEVVNAHDFYCTTGPRGQELVQTLNNLRECYENMFTAGCGEGGRVIGELMKRVFQDPLYLRYRYRPDCELHAARPVATGRPTSPPPASRSTPAPAKPTGEPNLNKVKSGGPRQIVFASYTVFILALVHIAVWR